MAKKKLENTEKQCENQHSGTKCNNITLQLHVYAFCYLQHKTGDERALKIVHEDGTYAAAAVGTTTIASAAAATWAKLVTTDGNGGKGHIEPMSGANKLNTAHRCSFCWRGMDSFVCAVASTDGRSLTKQDSCGEGPLNFVFFVNLGET